MVAASVESATSRGCTIPSMQKEFVLSLANLRFVSVSCQHCKTRVVLDLREPSEYAKSFGELLPNECPGCRKSYDSSLGPGLFGLQGAYNNLRKAEKQLSFRCDIPNEPE